MEAVKSVNSTNTGANDELSWMWQGSKKQPTKLFTAAASKPINTVNTSKRNVTRTPSPTTNLVGGAKNKKSRKSRRSSRKNKSRKSRKN